MAYVKVTLLDGMTAAINSRQVVGVLKMSNCSRVMASNGDESWCDVAEPDFLTLCRRLDGQEVDPRQFEEPLPSPTKT